MWVLKAHSTSFSCRQCAISLFPQDATIDNIQEKNIDMLLVSNGPGDPSVLSKQTKCLEDLLGTLLICGICLGHQLIAKAIGARIYKMSFGHHGGNHPVIDLTTKKLYITSQNHGFAVDEKTLPTDAKVWFRNTNDNTVEGIMYPSKKVYSVQFHPEASPGPLDTQWIIDSFLEKVERDAST